MAEDEFDKKVEALRREAQKEGAGFAEVSAPERETHFADWETQGMGDEELKRIGAHESQKETLPAFRSARISKKPRPSLTGVDALQSGMHRDAYLTSSWTDANEANEADRADPGRVDINTMIYAPYLPDELQDDPDALREAALDAARQNYSDTVDAHGESTSEASATLDGNDWTKHTFADGSVFLVENDGDGVVRSDDEPTGTFDHQVSSSAIKELLDTLDLPETIRQKL